MTTPNNHPILCIVAGGEGTRLQHTIKCNLELNGLSVLEHITKSLRTQFFEYYQYLPSPIILNINNITPQIQTLAQQLDLLLLPDEPSITLSGPLAGIKTGLSWVQKHKKFSVGMLTVAGDAPFLPKQLIPTLCKQAKHNQYKNAIHTCSNNHPAYTTGFWPIDYATHITQAIKKNELALSALHKTHGSLTQLFEHMHYKNNTDEVIELDPFFNINTPQDYILAQSISMIKKL